MFLIFLSIFAAIYQLIIKKYINIKLKKICNLSQIVKVNKNLIRDLNLSKNKQNYKKINKTVLQSLNLKLTFQQIVRCTKKITVKSIQTKIKSIAANFNEYHN